MSERLSENAEQLPDITGVSEAFDTYLEDTEKLENETFQIEQCSGEATKFNALRPEAKDENGQYTAEKAHYFVTGLFGPDESYFDALMSKMGDDDVYEIDRTGDFSMEHALNGILRNAFSPDDAGEYKNYQEIEIMTISIASGKMGKAVDNFYETNKDKEGLPKISLIYIDPFDSKYMALGESRMGDFAAKASRAAMKAVGELALIAAHPFRDVVLSRNVSAINEPTSIGFIAEQLAEIGRAELFNEDGSVKGGDYLNGVLQAGGKTREAANRDEFLDVDVLRGDLEQQGVNVYEKRSTHGVIDAANMDRGQMENPGDEVEDAYAKLRKDVENGKQV